MIEVTAAYWVVIIVVVGVGGGVVVGVLAVVVTAACCPRVRWTSFILDKVSKYTESNRCPYRAPSTKPPSVCQASVKLCTWKTHRASSMTSDTSLIFLCIFTLFFGFLRGAKDARRTSSSLSSTSLNVSLDCSELALGPENKSSNSSKALARARKCWKLCAKYRPAWTIMRVFEGPLEPPRRKPSFFKDALSITRDLPYLNNFRSFLHISFHLSNL